MINKSKLSTPEWILQEFDSKEDYEKSKGVKKSKKKDEKIFKVKICPECRSDNVSIVLTGEDVKNSGEWECKKCKWIGKEIEEKELSGKEFMKYLSEKGEEGI